MKDEEYTPERLDEIKASAQRLLLIGKLRDLDDVIRCLDAHYLKDSEIYPVMQIIWSDCASKNIPFREAATERFTKALGGNVEVAKKLVGLFEINALAEQLVYSYDAMRKQQSPEHAIKKSNPFQPHVLRENKRVEWALKRALTEASGSDRVLVNTVVDAYIANVKTNLGIDAGIGLHSSR